MLTLNPGVVNFTWEKTGGIGVSNSTTGNNFAVSGNRPQQNLFLLNGVEFTGAAENNMQPGGTSQELLGVDAVREFNVLRDSYGAEYGKRPGAQVLIVTQSGTNQVHGSLYEFLRNNDLDARNFFDGASAPGFRAQPVRRRRSAVRSRKTRPSSSPISKASSQHLHQTGVDLVPDTNARNGYLPCKLVSPAPTLVPSSGLAFVGVSPLINAWPAPSPGAPDFGGISEAFNNPLQTIRDDFGTVRLDHIFSPKDSLSAIYTIDDSADFTPTSTNSYSTDVESLREQVASLEETHVFSPTLLNTARVGFSRAGYFFTGEPTPGTPAASLPGFLAGDPIGAVVVGGSAASNPTAQLSLAGSNNGSNLHVARNLFTYEDRVSLTKGRHQFSVGVWFQRLQSNEDLALSQYGQATFTSLQTFLQGTGDAALRSYADAARLAHPGSARGTSQDVDPLDSAPHAHRSDSATNSPPDGTKRTAAPPPTPSPTASSTPSRTIGTSAFTVNNAKFLPQPRARARLEPVRQHAQDRDPRRLRHVQRSAGRARLPHRSERAVQSDLQPCERSRLVASRSADRAVPAAAKLVPGGVQPNLYTPTLISWSLRVEQEITRNTALTVGYVGSHGYHELARHRRE